MREGWIITGLLQHITCEDSSTGPVGLPDIDWTVEQRKWEREGDFMENKVNAGEVLVLEVENEADRDSETLASQDSVTEDEAPGPAHADVAHHKWTLVMLDNSCGLSID